MTQLTDKTTAMPLPDGAERVYYDGVNSIGFYLNGELRFIHLPPGNWRFLFTTEDVKEVPNGIVECKIVEYDGKVQGTRFINYTDPNQRRWFIEKSDSFKSLLRSKNLDLKNNYAIIEKL